MPVLMLAGCSNSTATSNTQGTAGVGMSGTEAYLNTPTAESLTVQNKTIYLLGEMNQFKPNSAYALVQQGENRYCTVSALRSDWSPYRFKFADAAWSSGTNFGFAKPPGTIYEGSAPVQLNANSRFEEIKFYPKEDGLYRFCLLKKGNEYFAEVDMVGSQNLAYLEKLLNTDFRH